MLASLFSPTDMSYASLIIRFRRKKQTDKKKTKLKEDRGTIPLIYQYGNN